MFCCYGPRDNRKQEMGNENSSSSSSQSPQALGYSAPVDREAMAAAAEQRLNKKNKKKTQGSTPAPQTNDNNNVNSNSNKTSSNNSSNSKGVSCPICQRIFANDMLVSRHMDENHSHVDEQKREFLAQQVEARLNNGKKNNNPQEEKQKHWERYQSIQQSSTDPSKQQVSYDASEVDSCLKRIQAHDAQTVDASMKMISKCLKNLIESDRQTRDQYRKIKLSHTQVQQAIVNVDGALDFFLAIGFELTTLPTTSGAEDQFLYYKHDTIGHLPAIYRELPLTNN